jgi:hypothetical protein
MKKILVNSRGTVNVAAYLRPFLGKLQFVQMPGTSVAGCFHYTEELAQEAVAELGEDKTTELPFINMGDLSPEEVFTALARLLPDKDGQPPVAEMVRSFSKGMMQWALTGFAKATPDQIADRLAVCKACEWWQPERFKGTGRCRKCGCSTWAKIRLRSASCPIGKWSEIRVEETKNSTTLNTDLT